MRITSALAVCAAGLALAAIGLTAGCETGTSEPAHSAYFGPGSSPNTTSGSGLTTPQPFTAIVIHSDLLRSATMGYSAGPQGPVGPGLANAGQVNVFVNDPTVTNPTLVVDASGTGPFLASGAGPVGQPNWLGFHTIALPPGGRYKVIADQGGNRVESNIVVVASINTGGTLQIQEPTPGDHTGLSLPIVTPNPPRVLWNPIAGAGITPPTSYAIMLGNPQPGIMGISPGVTPPLSLDNLEWMATIPAAFTSYSWGDAIADHYAILGPNPIPIGRHELTVLALDSTGWATDSSDAGFPLSIRVYTFEVVAPPP